MKRFSYLIFLLWIPLLFAQQQPKIDLQEVYLAISIDTLSQEIRGEVSHTIFIKEKNDSLFLNASDMNFDAVLLNGKKVAFKEIEDKLILYKKFKKGRTYQIKIKYKVAPKKAVYFLGWEDTRLKSQIWTQGQGKNSSHWVPCLDDMTDKALFNLDITFEESYEVIANGKLFKTNQKDGLKTWQYRMLKPMSSYLLAFAIGRYNNIKTESTAGVPIELYYYPEDSLKVEPTYRYSGRIFDYLTKEVGVSYPWQNYKQIPVHDFLYAGMENTGATIFSDNYVIDSISFIDRNYVNINAHELAHQWFGNMVTEVDASHHWLHEGFASYYALLVEKEIFGEDYFYWKLYDSANQLHSLSLEGKGESLNDPGASSITFYEKGAWALFFLSNAIGEEAYKKGIIAYLNRFGYDNVRVSDFINIMEEITEVDLKDFKEQWIFEEVFPFQQAKNILINRSEDLKGFFELEKMLITENIANEDIIKGKWGSFSLSQKERILINYKKSLSVPFLQTAFAEKDLKVRQALSYSVESVPEELRLSFESLLDDNSYITQENSLYRLWISFPTNRIKYLDSTKGRYGLPNYNLRLTWLTLALLTKGYTSSEAQKVYADELFGYTSNYYSYEIRQNAFSIISSVFPLRDQNLIDLIEATNHHYWQFRNYARTLLDELLDTERERERLLALAKKLNQKDLRYIRTKLNLE